MQALGAIAVDHKALTVCTLGSVSAFAPMHSSTSTRQPSVVRVRVGVPDGPAQGSGGSARRAQRGLSTGGARGPSANSGMTNTTTSTSARRRLARHKHGAANVASAAGGSARVGQESDSPRAFGEDAPQSDSYVHNLQQQIYLLEIEAATLRARSGMPETGVASAADRCGVTLMAGAVAGHASHAHAGHSLESDGGPSSFAPTGAFRAQMGAGAGGRHDFDGGSGTDGTGYGDSTAFGELGAAEDRARERLSGHELANPFIAAARTRPAGVEDVLAQFRGRVAAIEEHCRECLAAAGRREAALRKRVIALTTLTEQYRAELGRLEEVHEEERRSWESRFKEAARARSAAEAAAARAEESERDAAEAAAAEAERYTAEAAQSAETMGRQGAEIVRLTESLGAAEARADAAGEAAAAATAEAARLQEALATCEAAAATANSRAAAAEDAASRAEAARRRAETAEGDAQEVVARCRAREEALQADKLEAETASAAATTDMRAAEERAETLRTALTQAEQAQAAAEESQASAERQRGDMRAVLATTEAELAAIKTQLAAAGLAAREAEALGAEAAAREASIRGVRGRCIDERDDQASELQRALAALEESRRREAAFHGECERLRAALADATGTAAVDEHESDQDQEDDEHKDDADAARHG